MGQLRHLLVIFWILEDCYFLPYLPNQSCTEAISKSKRQLEGWLGVSMVLTSTGPLCCQELASIASLAWCSCSTTTYFGELEEQGDVFTAALEANCKYRGHMSCHTKCSINFLQVMSLWQQGNISKPQTCMQQRVHNHNPIIFCAHCNTISLFSSGVASRRLFSYKTSGVMNTNNVRAEKCSGQSHYGSYATALMHFSAFSFCQYAQ